MNWAYLLSGLLSAALLVCWVVVPPLSPEQLESTAAIQDEARSMSTLVGHLLDLARIESGEVTLNQQWQPLEEVVGSVMNATHSMLKQHLVEVHIPRDPPLVRIDALLIGRALVNFLEYASKYTPPGCKIILAAEVIADRLSVSVSDNGPGLKLGREEAVFQKFTRGELESATPGVGLGLPICRASVAAHHGTIVATYRPGGGARCTVTLPLGQPPAAVVEAEAAHG